MSYQFTPPNHPVECVISLEQGLLLPANALMNFIIESTIAWAQSLHPVIICHYLVERSHIHFFIFVEDPQELRDFMERFKTETAHYINIMLGRKKRTVWCESYSRPTVLTLSRAIKKIIYIYTNPAKDGLEKSIDAYPGLSSWKAFRSGKHAKRRSQLRRPMMPHMPGRSYSQYEYKRQMRALKRRSKGSNVLTLQPDAWLRFFDITDPEEIAAINQQIVDGVAAEELEFERLRVRDGKPVIGAMRLAAEHFDPDYMPERTGVKTWCLCDDKELRISYIAWGKSILKLAREVAARWKLGDFSVSFPPGVFPPSLPKRANMTALACDY